MEWLDKIFKFLTMFFAPLFVLCLHFFSFGGVSFYFFVFSLFFLFYTYKTKKENTELIMPSVYVIFFFFANYFSSVLIVKYIPLVLSLMFLFMFVDAHINKREMVLNFTNKFYKKELKQNELFYLKRGDFYWIWVMFANTLIHLYIVLFCSFNTWALYSSIGWYIYFFIALLAQITYIKLKTKESLVC